MTLLAPHRTHLPPAQRRRGWRRVSLLAALGFVAASGVQAQTVVGGNRLPSVSIDSAVLDELGPAPTLPQLFGASRPSTTAAAGQVTTVPRKPAPAATRRVVRHRSAAPIRRQVAAASDHLPFHLIPPAAPTPGSSGTAVVQPTSTPPIQPTSTALGRPVPAPAPLPNLPQSEEAPTPPVVAPTPPHVEAPTPPHAPPAQAANDAAPIPLAAAPQAAAPTPSPAPSAAPATDNATAGSASPAPTQVASAASTGGALNTVKFAAGAVNLPPGSQALLNTVAAKLIADDTLRVQLVAHASGSADQAMEARRISLARAVAVRAYLIDKGVRSMRMDVRALGNRADDGPPGDQVDLLVVSQ